MTIEDPVNIDGKEYTFEDLPELAQQAILRLNKVDDQLNAMNENMELLKFARDGCYNSLIRAMPPET